MASAAPKVAPKTAPLFKRLMPLFNRVLIKKADVPSQSKGGIVLPDNGKQKITKGTVVAVGPGSRTESGHQVSMSVRPGDEVILAEYGGTKIEMEGVEYFIFRESEILAKLYD